MATLINRRGKWYARVRWRDNNKSNETQISLKTKCDIIADYRLGIVEKKEHLIKKGVEFDFNDFVNGDATQIKCTLFEAVEEYLIHLKRYGRKKSTIQIRRESFNSFMKAIGKSFPADSIDINCINKFIDSNKGKLSDNGINMKLGHIRALCNYIYWEKELINKPIRIKKLKVDPKMPSYLNQQNIEDIMTLGWLEQHYKDVFRFYMETGCRLREPYNSHIKNRDWLIITKTKNGKVKKVKLQSHHIPVIEEIYARLEKSNTSLKIFGDYYSRQFKEAARSIGRGELHLHNMRDTFAITRYYETRDIYQVCKDLCHSSVTITEKYANFFTFEELEADFPVLADGSSFLDFMGDLCTPTG